MLPPPPNTQRAAQLNRGKCPRVVLDSHTLNHPLISSSAARRVVYVHSEKHLASLGLFATHEDRDCLTHALIDATGLLKSMRLIEPISVAVRDLMTFHSKSFAELILRNDLDDDAKAAEVVLADYGMEDDCFPFAGMGDYVQAVAGGSLAAARELAEESADVGIHWGGGCV